MELYNREVEIESWMPFSAKGSGSLSLVQPMYHVREPSRCGTHSGTPRDARILGHIVGLCERHTYLGETRHKICQMRNAKQLAGYQPTSIHLNTHTAVNSHAQGRHWYLGLVDTKDKYLEIWRAGVRLDVSC